MADEIHDKVFGLLQRDPYLGSWLGEVEFRPKRPVQVIFWQYEDGQEKNLRREQNNFAWVQGNNEIIHERVASEIVKVYKDQKEFFAGQQRKKSKDLVGHLKLMRVGFFQDGKFCLSFEGVKWFGRKDFILANFGPGLEFVGLDDNPEVD